ncbi:MAG: hypothetical protein COA69_02825 [Robiginitomaculum sp.]|nr:MAG: hypothetical protein COA69_02825 [Robiginitomaculum sp.]
MAQSTPILILGMHRSGTSCLAGSLENAGLYLGDVNTEAGFNKKGNRENRTAMELHEQVLERVGASWDNPPAQDPVWTPQETQHLREIIESYPDDQQWGLKDPRVLFMMEGWKTLTTPRFIGTFRHPAEVAASLIQRAQKWDQPMDEDTAFNIWAIYNKRMLALHMHQKFDILRYDIPATTYHKNLIKAGNSLNLEVPDKPEFRESALHNQQVQNTHIPIKIKPIWEALNDIAL